MNKVQSEPCSLHMEPVMDFGGRGVHHDSGEMYLGCIGVLGRPRVHHDSPCCHDPMVLHMLSETLSGELTLGMSHGGAI